MTLIGFATYGDRAEFITDTWSYTPNCEELGTTSKQTTIPHLDAAVIAGGDMKFAIQALTVATAAASDCATYDDLVDFLPQALPNLWNARLVDRPECHGSVFTLGWSARDDRFAAHMTLSEQGFKSIQLNNPFCMPAAFSFRISGMERRRLQKGGWGRLPDDSADPFEVWNRQPPLRAPQSVQGWVDLAQTVRDQRTFDPWAQTRIGGDLLRTVLRRGDCHTRKVHTFVDTDAEFAEIVAWSQHPVALAATCYCNSGQRYGACHGRRCDCGAIFNECETCTTAAATG